MEFRNIRPKDDALVVRSNQLIEARYASTLHQQRIMLWLISEIRPEDRDFQTYRVSIKELSRFVGLEGNKDLYRQLGEATRGMIGQVVEIGSLEEGELLQVGLISSAQYKVGEGFIDLSIDPALRPFLLDLKANFTTAYLRDLLSMKSVYGIRMYDLLNQYRRIGKRTLKVEDLKTVLGIKKKYKLYGHFKTRVVEPALKESNERTDLHVSYTERKAGRSVEALVFTLLTKDVVKTIEHDPGQGAPTNIELVDRLMSHGMKEDEARKIVSAHNEDPDRITDNIDKLEEGMRAGKVNKPVPWLRKAINEDYRDQKSLFQKNTAEAVKEARKRAEEHEEKAKKAELLQQRMEQQTDAYNTHRREFAVAVVNAQPKATQEAWEEEFRASLVAPIRKAWAEGGRWGSKTTITSVENFIKEKTDETCTDQDKWFEQNGYPELEELRKKREALL